MLYTSLVAEAALREFDPAATLTISVHPLPLTVYQKSMTNNFNVGLLVCFIMLAAPFMPAAFATFVIRETETKAKYQQIVSGVSIMAYWWVSMNCSHCSQ